jgi:hypothetical protein
VILEESANKSELATRAPQDIITMAEKGYRTLGVSIGDAEGIFF